MPHFDDLPIIRRFALSSRLPSTRRPARLVTTFLVLSFLVALPVQGQTAVLAENFDAVTPPAAPAGWVLDTGWETSSGSSSTGSGLNNLAHSGSQATSARTPVFDLAGATFATLSYLARRTGSYDVTNLRVAASTDGGATFPITVFGAGAALPSASSTYELISVALPSSLLGSPDVVVRFEGQGISASSSNARLDDVTVEMYTSDDAAGGTLGFQSASGEAVAEDDSVLVPLRLDFTAPSGLQGIQFRVGWTIDSLSIADVLRGPAVADEGTWTVSYEAGPHSVDVVLLGEGVSSLPAGTYDSLLTMRFTAGAVETEIVDVLALSDVLGALAIPEGSDANVQAGSAAHTLTIVPGTAVFLALPEVVDVGWVDVDDVDSAVVTVYNPGGTKELLVTSVTSTNPLFSVNPDSGLVAPDDSLQFAVTFAPADTAFGIQEADLVFEHNGSESPSTISIQGKGRGGRGDAEGDGSVDVLDIVHAIDFVLARISPEPAQASAADLFPFPAGDGTLDVRDLTVLSQAVARGQWPDGFPLPIESVPVAKVSSGVAHVTLQSTGVGEYVLELQHDVPIRAFQLILPTAERTSATSLKHGDGFTLRTGYDAERGELRIVGFVANGGAIEAGVRRLAVSARVGSPRYATVIGTDLDRIAVDAHVPTLLESEEVPDDEMGGPYPNPYPSSGAPLRIERVPPDAHVSIFDVLGREVLHREAESGYFEWDGRDAAGRVVAPGLYVARLRTASLDRTWTVVVVR
ncbi:MAG: hypothetical protein WD423_12115 [Rhodothermales bacterium]